MCPRAELVSPCCCAGSQQALSDPGLPSHLTLPSACFCLGGMDGAVVTVGPEQGLGQGSHSHGNILLADGELYTGTVSNFQGNDPAISRSQSSRPTKTESSLNWLQGGVLPQTP